MGKTVTFDRKRENFGYVEKIWVIIGKNGKILVIFGKIFFFFRKRVVSKVHVKISEKIRYNGKNGLYNRTVPLVHY